MKKNTIVRHCFSRKYISLCIFLLLGIIGEKAFAYSVWETYANETEGIYFSLQESIKITGVVKDNKGEPIIGANIVELNKKGNGTITDIDGYFSLEIPKGATHLKVSYIGYTAQVVSIGNKTEVNIVMKEDSQMLDEVVVVGYGTQKKVTLTGAVASIKEAELISTKNENTQNMLTGKISGVRVMQKSAEPGSFNNNFDIRGMGDRIRDIT